MTDAVDVTVIVPTYEGARHLDACLDSIAAQDLDGVEVLVVDDCSTDDSVAIAESFAGRIPDLRVVRNDERLGAVANVNRCIELARGRWIKPVFQDDLIDPGCLAAMRAARRPRVPIVVCGRRYLFEGDVPSFRREACDHLVETSLCGRFGDGLLEARQLGVVLADQAAQGYPQVNLVGEPVVALFEKRAALRTGGIDDGYVQLWDYELALRLAMRRGMVLVARPLATFRVHESSETARNFAQQAFRANVLDRLRLHVAYATGRWYRPVRWAAARSEPPSDLIASALGVARAARVLRDRLPEEARADATGRLDALSVRLPDPPPGPAAAQAEWMEAKVVDELATGPWLSLSDDPVDLSLPDPTPEPGPNPPVATPATADGGVGDDGGAVPEPAPGPTPRRRGTLATVAKAATALRTNQWWGHMLGPIVAFACLQLGWRAVPPGEGIVRVLVLVGTSILLASYGYLVNDASDIEQDRAAGKPNAMARFSPAVRLAIIVAFATAGVVPWLFLDLSVPALVLLGIICLIPLLYSARPVRLKERHLLGPLADASNAFVVPSLFTIALFAPLGDPAGPAWLMVVGAVLWTGAFGLRAILKHQIDDADNDRAAGARTLVLAVGVRRATWAMRSVLFPVELVGLAILVVTVALWSWGTALAGVGFFAVFQALRLGGILDRRIATLPLAWGGWMYWQQIWPALLVSVGLWVSSPWYVLLTGFVVVLFWPRVRSGFTQFLGTGTSEARRFRARLAARS